MKKVMAMLLVVLSFCASASETKIEDFEMYCSSISLFDEKTGSFKESDTFGMFVTLHTSSDGRQFASAVSFNGLLIARGFLKKDKETKVNITHDGLKSVSISDDGRGVILSDDVGDIYTVNENKNNCTKKFNSKKMKNLKSM